MWKRNGIQFCFFRELHHCREDPDRRVVCIFKQVLDFYGWCYRACSPPWLFCSFSIAIVLLTMLLSLTNAAWCPGSRPSTPSGGCRIRSTGGPPSFSCSQRRCRTIVKVLHGGAANMRSSSFARTLQRTIMYIASSRMFATATPPCTLSQ